jgi:hypothetical protein
MRIKNILDVTFGEDERGNRATRSQFLYPPQFKNYLIFNIFIVDVMPSKGTSIAFLVSTGNIFVSASKNF